MTKKRSFFPTVFAVFLMVAFCPLMYGCGNEAYMMRQKLDVILDDDLETILEGVDPDGLLEEPFFRITEYKVFGEGTYSARAVVSFYFLRGVQTKIIRKYRYHRTMGMWDRYYNRYHFHSHLPENARDD